ncbi:MAG TPA: crosslink repair DNA glycosylase YcaQ family protein [Anaerolineae bacterium]|nr:crosslink repair DNA glycosylase YcaQ family protein [Anaerolineae bacterium]
MPQKLLTLSQAQLTRLRDTHYRRKPGLRLKNPADAVRFVNERGFCFFWPITGIEMPSLWAAVAGNRPVADEHDDPGHVTWGWKDQSLDKRWWYYAKLLRGRATLVALDVLPYFYALSENFGGPEDYLEEYRAGRLSLEAKTIYEALRDLGSMDTVRLRRETRMTADTSKARFEKALTDLQKGLKILPVGVAQAGAWRYAFMYELVDRWFPDLPASARDIARGAARVELARRYLENVIAATPATLTRVFGWRKDEMDAAIATLLESGAIVSGVQVEGERGEHIVDTSVWRR